MRFLSLVIILPLIVCATQAAADSISCDGGIVSSGNSAADLLIKCGRPEWKDSRTEEIVDEINRDMRNRTYVTVEDWTYNFGTNQFLRIVTLRNGVVSRIRTGGYGAPKDREPPGPGCGDRVISTGDTKADVRIRCGEPFYKDAHQEELKQWFDGIGSRSVMVTVEEWTYNFGPQRFMRVITFRNGTVVEVRTGGYGR